MKEFLIEDSTKYHTLKKVYRLIYEHGPLSKADLQTMTNIKHTTLVRIIDELLIQQFIFESGLGNSSGGRPPVLYEIVQNRGYIIGIDISRTHTTIALLGLKLSIIEKYTFPMTHVHTPEIVIENIIDTIKLFMQRHNVTEEDLIGIGVGSVGPLDRKLGLILDPDSFPCIGWNHVPIVSSLEKVFPVKVLLENGANTAAFAEYLHSSAIGQDILYCINGVGLRCGMLVNGQVVQNKTGVASAFGHMIVDIDGRECICGRKGCLLSYTSLDSMKTQIYEQIAAGGKSLISTEQTLTFELLIQAAKAGDEIVENVILNSAHYYGIGIANMINFMQLDQVLLNGPLIYEYPPYYEKIVQTAQKYMFNTYENAVLFNKGALKEDAVPIGAAALLLNTFFT
ncbi:ROK family transcriptional regulator [Bacillus sp. FJAT-49732]|uniref:ROK family transcriptional regulator n=1 Tax=Lederbergia citrisecunda TaxID=2833583 RepID=A0A942TPT6_9BACI|nr:ROK family transcriptional regulator [Lederbergia citrisecunda]MBS4199852.1 ROK family transcriptional regulator [Lederbergia citrisecunda]